MNIIGIIPARMASSRFPGKPLAKICGTPMVGHVYYRSKMSHTLEDVYIATCDEEIAAYSSSIDAKAIMTANTHDRASDRTAEAMLKIETETKQKIDSVVMIQGDEPMLHPEMINQAVAPLLQDKTIQVVNLMSKIKSKEEHKNPNEIKVVVDAYSFALYFSREPIPSWRKDVPDVPIYKQVCIIPFTRQFLLKFNELEPKSLEVVESVDMLRVLEYGYKVKMVKTRFETYSVDTPEDLDLVENLMKNDPLLSKYSK